MFWRASRALSSRKYRLLKVEVAFELIRLQFRDRFVEKYPWIDDQMVNSH